LPIAPPTSPSHVSAGEQQRAAIAGARLAKLVANATDSATVLSSV
jgi:ABC-type ATPase involved in cell division